MDWGLKVKGKGGGKETVSRDDEIWFYLHKLSIFIRNTLPELSAPSRWLAAPRGVLANPLVGIPAPDWLLAGSSPEVELRRFSAAHLVALHCQECPGTVG